jgi:hypothetical protein
MKTLILSICLLLASNLSIASNLDQYASVKPLLLQALDDPSATIQGEMIGPIAGKFRATTRSTAPVIATVTTIKQFNQPGCSRLNLRFEQANVLDIKGKPITFAMNIGINYCKNGEPPLEGMDIGKIVPMLKQGM